MSSLDKQFGIHPLDVNKTTISGYGSYLFQRNLMIHKRVGQYAPNVLPIYVCLKNAASGGLTMVTRHSADGKNQQEEASLNSHLIPDNEEKGEGTICCDVTSLYPSSMLKGLPYGPGYYFMQAKTNPSIKTKVLTKCYDRYGRELMNKISNLPTNEHWGIEKWCGVGGHRITDLSGEGGVESSRLLCTIRNEIMLVMLRTMGPICRQRPHGPRPWRYVSR